MKNELYNPEGGPFSTNLQLPFGGSAFDLIFLFSVLTHLPPDDYRTMLTVLRRYVRSDGNLFFTLFIDELTEGGHGLIYSASRLLADDPRLLESKPEALDADGRRRVERFRELDSSGPGLPCRLLRGLRARELIEETGWRVVRLSPPNHYIQHSFVCRPA